MQNQDFDQDSTGMYSEADHEHAVISTFDLFSIGIGPSSSHTVGPMRAGAIFVADLVEAGLLLKVDRIIVHLYGSLALTGEGHMTPSALLLGLESADVETVDTSYVPKRFDEIKATKKLFLGHGLPGNTGKEVSFNYERDFVWKWGQKLPLHSNGMRLTVYDDQGDVLATNDMFSVGGGFVVNGALSISPTSSPDSNDRSDLASAEPGDSGHHPADLAENIYYKETHRANAAGDRRTGSGVKNFNNTTEKTDNLLEDTLGSSSGTMSPVISGTADVDVTSERATKSQQPPYPFSDAASLLNLCHKHQLTIAQLVFENEKSFGYSENDIYRKLFRLWGVMDSSILEGVQAPRDSTLPGSLKLHRRAPALYSRLTRGLYSSQNDNDKGLKSLAQPSSAKTDTSLPSVPDTALSQGQVSLWRRQTQTVHGSFDHPIMPSPSRRTTLAAMDYLTVYAIAVNETNAAGGRIVTAPTNGAAGIIPAVLKYVVEFVSDDPERDIATFLLTAAAIGMLYKRGATISAAEGGCMAEVGVACSMAAGAFAACMGAKPETIEQAAEIGIEHNLGLTCDPIGGLVQAPCIERNALGAVKAISSANLALSGDSGTQKVRLDDAIRAMRLTAKGMRDEFKETSLSGLATSVPFKIPVSVPDC
ncbi:L-serine ammonia-lyase [Exophiala spinifera]|uniref:L-serine ammonia-lyase n=1 Tax=Exophiala spinifera TaxID=91928 RepID=A0A0D2C366_9EURO|nr:L-serine ammonia-lyase [Exophiala spinifera]KIW18019.1 L-serine ammonia-lyase [Exophiala spinifera]